MISTLDVRGSEALPHRNGRALCADGDRYTLPGLVQMSEQELLAALHRVADACERLDQEVTALPSGSGSSGAPMKLPEPLRKDRSSWPR